jgi:hypothetical protein
MLTKQQLTQQILNQLPVDDRPSFELALKSWWQDIREDSGLRLSMSGYDAFKFLKIDQYEFDFVKVLSPSFLMTLDRKLDCPYYLKAGKTTKLIMFGSKQAVMYSLYGDINRFISAITHAPDVYNRE